jgi:NhaP-type Na+/H+ and K+/H+ antiporter
VQVSRGSLYDWGGGGDRTCVLSQYVGVNTLLLYVHLKLCTNVDGMFDIVFTKLNFSSGDYVVKFAYLMCALSQIHGENARGVRYK